MSEMVERVAMKLSDSGLIPFTVSYEKIQMLVTLAIKEMREPTDGMIVAAYKDPSFVPNESPTGTWQAMIDEALK